MTEAGENKDNKKIFIDAFQSFGQFFLAIFGIFFLSMILYISPIRLFTETLKARGLSIFSDIFLLIFFISLVGLPIVLILFFLIVKIKYGLYRKIITYNNGISFWGLFGKSSIKWEDITVLGIHNSLLLHIFNITAGKIKMAEVIVRDKKYYFPLSMKLKGQEYPSFYRFQLVDENYNKINDISPENCPLYVEIQKHLRK